MDKTHRTLFREIKAGDSFESYDGLIIENHSQFKIKVAIKKPINGLKPDHQVQNEIAKSKKLA